MLDFLLRRIPWIGPLALIAALFGLAVPAKVELSVRALLLSWLAAAALFGLLDQRLGDTVRWYYLAAAAVALLAGRFLAMFLQRGLAARLLFTLSLSLMLIQLLTFWVGDLIFTRYH